MENRKNDLSGSYEDKTVIIIGNDPRHKQEVEMKWLTEKKFDRELSRCRSEEGKYSKITSAFENSPENFVRIKCRSSVQAVAISNAFRNKVRHGSNWKSRTHKNYVYVQKLENHTEELGKKWENFEKAGD